MGGIEEYKRIDIRFLHKNRLLWSGTTFPFSWTRGGEKAGDIGVRVQENSLLLSYCYTFRGESESVEERVQLDWTRCTYGGRRPWFICPGCGRRVCILAQGGRLFLCRHCYRLKYSSQLETELDRAHRRVAKLEKRLGEKTWLKPKAMHQCTYERLIDRLVDAEVKVSELFEEGGRRIAARSFRRLRRRH